MWRFFDRGLVNTGPILLSALFTLNICTTAPRWLACVALVVVLESRIVANIV